MRRSVALFVALASVALAGVVGAPAAGGEDLVSIRAVDATDFPEIRVTALFTGDEPDLSAVAVREDGRLVPDIDVVPAAESTRPAGVVLVVDTSGSMEAGGKLARAKEAARRFVAKKEPGDVMALVAFANEARIAVNFTADASLLTAAIDGLAASGETALWDAVRLGSGLFADAGDLVPYLVVLSDGADTVSAATPDEALGSVEGAGAGVFPIALTGGGESDAPALRRLAEASGGIFLETTDAARLDALYARVQRVLSNQYEISWASEAGAADGVLDVSVKLGDAVAAASVPVRSVGTGAVARPEVVDAPSAPGPLSSSAGAFVVAGLVALALGCLGAAGVSNLARDRTPLQIVEAYTRAPASGQAPAEESRDLVPEAVRRAVEATARLTGGGGLLERLERKLDAADVKVRPQEFVVFHAAGVLAVAVVVALAGGPTLALAAGIVATLVPLAALNLLAERRRKAFTAQLPDALQLLASSLRAGYSLVQGLEAVADEIDDPMGRELRRAVLETKLGRDLEVALDETARRMDSPDFDWVVIAIRIQREIGGNLAELLTSVADTMVSRERLRREVSSLTAEGRLSAIVVGSLPFAVGGMLFVLNPGYVRPLFSSGIGQALVLAAVGLTCAGFVWMRKVMTVDV